MLALDFVGGSQGAADFGSLLGGYGGASTGGTRSDLSATLGGIAGVAGDSDSVLGNALGAAASGAASGMAFGPIGASIGAGLGALTALFSGGKTDESKQSADVNRIAANNGVTPAEAGAVIAQHCNVSSDNFNDLAAYVASNNARFASLLVEYNQANPSAPIRVGSVKAAAEAQAAQQQQLITTALTTPNFATTGVGSQFINTLQALPVTQTVGTQGQTVGQILGQVVKGIGDGALKGGSDAAAETDFGKSMKKSYIKDWAKENQLLAAGIGAFGVFGLVKLYEQVRGKGGKISL